MGNAHCRGIPAQGQGQSGTATMGAAHLQGTPERGQGQSPGALPTAGVSLRQGQSGKGKGTVRDSHQGTSWGQGQGQGQSRITCRDIDLGTGTVRDSHRGHRWGDGTLLDRTRHRHPSQPDLILGLFPPNRLRNRPVPVPVSVSLYSRREFCRDPGMNRHRVPRFSPPGTPPGHPEPHPRLPVGTGGSGTGSLGSGSYPGVDRDRGRRGGGAG